MVSLLQETGPALEVMVGFPLQYICSANFFFPANAFVGVCKGMCLLNFDKRCQ